MTNAPEQVVFVGVGEIGARVTPLWWPEGFDRIDAA